MSELYNNLKKGFVWINLMLQLSQPILASASVTVDKSAPGNNRPYVEMTTNGLPIVQITTPSAAGISRNFYRQFDVTNQGLIFNNSRDPINTQLAGYIPGNQFMIKGTAKIILNEVTGENKSYLRGWMEVAGSRAGVVIANPNGIVGNGFGFINTNRAVLTTGTPSFGGDGSLEAFRVSGGEISIEEAGLNASNIDRVDLISRAVNVNAGIWAKELNVISGSNQIDYTNLTTNALATSSKQPQVAIDVGTLGGMYANKIKLIGTEEGVGVNNQGNITAIGDLTLTNKGAIVLAGKTTAGQGITITTQDQMNVQGMVYAQGETKVSSSGTLNNSGIIAATQNTEINAGAVSSTGRLEAGVKSDGTIGTSGNLTITATRDVTSTGQNLAGGNLAITGASIEQRGALSYAGQGASITATSGGIDHSGATLQVGGTLIVNSAGDVRNNKIQNGAAGQISAEQVKISAGGDISNRGSSILQTGVNATALVATGRIDNTDGVVATNGTSLLIQGNSITNTNGKIQHAGEGLFTVRNSGGDVVNINGVISGNGQVSIQARKMDNTHGSIIAKKQLGIDSNSLTNNEGIINSGDAVRITSSENINNQNGLIQGNDRLDITARLLENQHGKIVNLSANETNLTITDGVKNEAGLLGGNGDVNVKAANLTNTQGKIQAQGKLTILTEQDIDNSGSITATKDMTIAAQNISGNGLIFSGQDMNILSSGDLINNSGGEIKANGKMRISAGNDIRNHGRINGGGSVAISGNNIINTNTITADTLEIKGNTISNNSSAALMNSTGAASFIASGAIANQGTIYAQGNANVITKGVLSNTGMLAAGKNTDISAQSVLSTGTLGSGIDSNGNLIDSVKNINNGNLSVTANQELIVQGKNLAAGNLFLQGTTADLSGAITYVSGNNATITALNGDVNHTGASLQAQGGLNISASGAVKNNKSVNTVTGKITANHLTIIGDTITNQGNIAAIQNINLSGGQVNNEMGATIVANKTLQLTTTGDIINSGTISGESIDAHGKNINNTGTMVANTVTAQANVIDNAGTIIATAGDVNLGLIANPANCVINQGKIFAQGNADIRTTGALTNSGILLASQNTTVAAQSVASIGTLGAGINTNGTLGNRGDLKISAADTVSATGKNLAGGNLTINGTSINQSGATTIVGDVMSITATNGNINHTGASLQAGGAVNISATTGTVQNDKSVSGTAGQIQGEQVTIAANGISNNGGIIIGRQSTNLTSVNKLDNIGGIIASNGSSLSIQAQSLTNSQGRIQHAGIGNLKIITAGNLDNSDGNITTNGELQLNAIGTISNHGGSVNAQKEAVIQSQGNIDNSNNGSIVVGDNLQVMAQGDVNNSSGRIKAASDITLRGTNFNNAGGTNSTSGAATINIDVTSDINNRAGVIGSNGNLIVKTSSIDNANSTMSAQGDFHLNINGDFTNQGNLKANGILAINVDNIINPVNSEMNSNNTIITATGNISNAGRIEGNQVTTTSQNIVNTGTIIGNDVSVNAKNLVNQGQSALIAGTRKINLWGANSISNQNGSNITSLGDINIAADSRQDDNGLFINRTQQVINTAASIEAGKNLNIAVEQVTNNADPVQFVTTTSPYTQVLVQKPWISSWTQQGTTKYDSGWGHGGITSPFYTTAWKLRTTVPQADVISYDKAQKKLIFSDSNITSYQVLARIYGWGHSAGNTPQYINGPINYQGKISGKTTAYCSTVSQDANGDYYIEYYPGYDPQYNLNPDTVRSVSTDRSSDAQEVRRSYNGTVTQDSITNSPTIGRINVGQNMSLNIGQQFLNKYSSVTVGETIRGSIGTFQNEALKLQRTTNATVESRYYAPYGAGGTWADITQGPFETVDSVEGGLPAIFTAKNILVTGSNVLNIVRRPNGTTIQLGGTTDSPRLPGNISMTTADNDTANAISQGDSVTTVTMGAGATNTKVTNENSAVTAGTINKAATSYALAAGKLTNHQTINVIGTVTIPKNGLFTTRSDPNATYLVETNSRFSNYSTYTSSDYLMKQLSVDPAKVAKRLGDGFYEQRLVNEQISQLTGRQYLLGYNNTDEEYRALLDNGVTTAKTLELIPGIALTNSQIANLTTDLVWMVEQTVSLPNGTTQKALVPQVYLSQAHAMKLSDSGALIAADKIDMGLMGNLDNNGTIKGKNSTSIQGANITNSNSGKITSDGITNLIATEDIVNQSATISGKQVVVFAGGDIINETVTRKIFADSKNTNSEYPWAGSNTVVGQKGAIKATGDLTMMAGHNISVKGGDVVGAGNTIVNAGGNLEVGTVVADSNNMNIGKNSHYENSSTMNVSSDIQGNNVSIASGGDSMLTGVQVSAQNDLSIGVQGNLTINATKDSRSNNQEAGDSKQYHARNNYDETVVGSNLHAVNNVTIVTGAVSGGQQVTNSNVNSGNISIEGGNIDTGKGKITIVADKEILVKETTERHASGKADRVSNSNIFSTTTTEGKDATVINQVKGSSISGDTVNIQTGTDLTVSGSNVVGTNDVKLSAGGNVNIQSAQETGGREHYRYEKTTGIFSSGLGFTIGSKSEKIINNEQTIGEVGSTIGSINSNVSITAGNKVDSAGTTFVAGKDINVTGQEVNIDNTINTYDSQTKYEFKQSGLAVSLGGGIVTNAVDAAGNIKRSGEVKDERLKALYEYKAAQDIGKMTESKGNLKSGVAVSVGIGSTKTTSEQTEHVETVNTSNINAGGNVNFTATDGDLNLKGTKLNAVDIALDAKQNINIEGSDNKQQTTSNTSSSSWALGASVDLSTKGVGYFGNVSSAKGNENGSSTNNVGSVIDASGTLTLKSGNDTNINGSKVKGDKVVADIKGDLNIASKQDRDNYTAKNQSIGLGFTAGEVLGSRTGSFNTGKTDSNYASVTDQAGIFAGKDGFDITVGKNTDLKGAVIASKAEAIKNALKTGTLTFANIANRAIYNSSSIGANLNTNPNAKYNEQGFTPNIGVPATGNAESTTKSAVANGTIEIRSNPNQDISNLSRDTSGSLNTLGKIFDKQTVQEQQELAKVFGEVAYEEVHHISDRAKGAAQKELDKAIADKKSPEQIATLQAKVNSWDVGGTNKVALHALVGGIMSDLGGSGFSSGAVGAGFNQVVQKELKNRFENQPDMWQWASAVVGATATSIIGGDVQAGASTAASGTKNNDNAWSTYRDTQRMRKLAANTGETVRSLIDAGIIGDPRTMECDYAYFELSVGLGKFAGGAGGFMVDKQGNVYVIVDLSAGIGLAPPITGTVGKGYVGNISDADRADLSNALSGLSAGITSVAGIGGNISAGVPSIALTGEIQASLGIGKSAGVRYAIPIFNIPR